MVDPDNSTRRQRAGETRVGAFRGFMTTVAGSLKLKFIAMILCLLSLTVGVAPWGAITVQKRQLLQAVTERLDALHNMMYQDIVGQCTTTGDRGEIQKLFTAAGAYRDIERVRLFDGRGRILFSSRPAEIGKRLSHAQLRPFYGHPEPVLLDASGLEARYSLVRPIFAKQSCHRCHKTQEKVLGVLQVTASLDETWRQLGQLRHAATLATAITLVVVSVGIWMSLSILIDQPAQELVAVMARVENADFSARVERRSRDELGRLGQHLNEMIARLDVAQRKLQQYHQKQLERAERLATIGEMAAAIAHEIRNPLTGISGVLSVLGRDFPEGDPRRQVLRDTRALMGRLNDSIEAILHYARPAPPELQNVRLEPIVDRTLVLVAGEAKKAQVWVGRDAAPEQAPAPSPVTVDPYQVQQVLLNLVLNAIQATPAGGQVRIGVVARDGGPLGRRVCLVVEDSGAGMTEEQRKQAFHPFFTTKARGTGLGLPIARQIIERHGGRIVIDSTPGKGTRVQVEFPASPPAATAGSETT